MPCKKLTIQEYDQLMIDNPGAVGSDTRETCCCPPQPDGPPECCICVGAAGDYIYRDSPDLNARGLPGNIVDNPLNYCPADWEEKGALSGYSEERQQWIYAPICFKRTLVDCGLWLQVCADPVEVNPTETPGIKA